MSSIKGLFIGAVCADAVGQSFETLPLGSPEVTDMVEGGTYNQPIGTWTDDTSMSWCTAEAILEGYTPQKLVVKFLDFMERDKYTADETVGVFDIGIQTSRALTQARWALSLAATKGTPAALVPHQLGGRSEAENGNGSLMRTAPLIVILKPLDRLQRFQLVREVSSITHAHVRSVLACFWLCEYLLYLEETVDKFGAYKLANASFLELFRIEQLALPEAELDVFHRILSGKLHEVNEKYIRSSGYVLDTLECCLYSFLVTLDYRSAVLRGINFFEDTDTVGSITGNIAGFYYGYESIPTQWVTKVKRIDELLVVAERLEQYYAFVKGSGSGIPD